MNIRELTKEQLAEESLIDLAYAVLEERKSPIAFHDLLKVIQSLNGLSDEEIQARLVQFYTDMNIDGRFLLNHENGWGLREWYKVETIEEETAPTVKARKRKSKAVDEEEEELIVDEDDLVFEEDFEEFVDEEEIDELDDEEDLEFVEEEIDDLDDVDADIDDEIIEDDEEFIIEDDEETEELEEEEEE
ncbi:DNA-directed RNA polymerase subunit delta [Lysinibacillus endophyticus]|uniref:DNA-directed RNA polymerase subunit delta n=1 Tax=Ureibacillus endophyticus TaxID=1978490 RepID=UPI00209FF03C|nr:DNA-directed RNA polymerase subunit delta [Lysinibacillus endophyticus]MCP1143592.1 DNA-directed RNA polymerase subunit delta [Lysinibacillus endophyticus]